MVTQRVFPALDLVVHTITGELDESQWRRAGEALYGLDPVPRLSLWDLSDATLTDYSLGRLRYLQSSAVDLVRERERGRTAVVAPTDLAYGLTRQYISLIDSAELPFEHSVFRTTEEALVWLGLEADSLDRVDPEAEP